MPDSVYLGTVVIDADYPENGVNLGKLVRPKLYSFQITLSGTTGSVLRQISTALRTKYTLTVNGTSVPGLIFAYTPDPDIGDSFYYPVTKNGKTFYDRIGCTTSGQSSSYLIYSADIDFTGISVNLIRQTDYDRELILPWERVLPLDVAEYFETTPSQQQIREKAQQYLTVYHVAEPKVTTTVSFTDLRKTTEYENYRELESVVIGDTVSVSFPKLGISTVTRVTAAEYDVLTDKYISVTLGERKKDISDEILRMDRNNREKTESVGNSVGEKVDTATYVQQSKTSRIEAFLSSIGYSPYGTGGVVNYANIVAGINAIPANTPYGDSYTRISSLMVPNSGIALTDNNGQALHLQWIRAVDNTMQEIALLRDIQGITDNIADLYATLAALTNTVNGLSTTVNNLSNNQGGGNQGGDPDPGGNGGNGGNQGGECGQGGNQGGTGSQGYSRTDYENAIGEMGGGDYANQLALYLEQYYANGGEATPDQVAAGFSDWLESYGIYWDPDYGAYQGGSEGGSEGGGSEGGEGGSEGGEGGTEGGGSEGGEGGSEGGGSEGGEGGTEGSGSEGGTEGGGSEGGEGGTEGGGSEGGEGGSEGGEGEGGCDCDSGGPSCDCG